MYDIAVFCGRFRPFHSGHLDVIRQGLDKAKYVFVVVGSIDQPINTENPFTYEQVREMIRGSLAPTDLERVFIFGVPDVESNTYWAAQVQEIVQNKAERLGLQTRTVALLGHAKDSSSFYLKLFPVWDTIEAVPYSVPDFAMDASAIRQKLYLLGKEHPIDRTDHLNFLERSVGHEILPAGTFTCLREWVTSPEFERMRDEYLFMEDYLGQFNNTPYPRNFNTADACCFHAGAVLLVKRDAMPGAGLWALPGGHVNPDETFQEASLRELKEETNIGEAIDDDVLKLSMRGMKLCDKPKRSTRKRTVSVAYSYNLTGTTRPPVQGMDDAKEARWWDVNEVTRQMMFEDHFQIIEFFINQNQSQFI